MKYIILILALIFASCEKEYAISECEEIPGVINNQPCCTVCFNSDKEKEQWYNDLATSGKSACQLCQEKNQ